jgi:hypothetical protein
MVAERQISHDTLFLVFERLNRSGDLNVILQAVHQRIEGLEQTYGQLMVQVNIADSQSVDEFRKLQGRLDEARRMFNAFRHWGTRKHYDGDGSEGTKERVTA